MCINFLSIFSLFLSQCIQAFFDQFHFRSTLLLQLLSTCGIWNASQFDLQIGSAILMFRKEKFGECPRNWSPGWWRSRSLNQISWSHSSVDSHPLIQPLGENIWKNLSKILIWHVCPRQMGMVQITSTNLLIEVNFCCLRPWWHPWYILYNIVHCKKWNISTNLVGTHSGSRSVKPISKQIFEFAETVKHCASPCVGVASTGQAWSKLFWIVRSAVHGSWQMTRATHAPKRYMGLAGKGWKPRAVWTKVLQTKLNPIIPSWLKRLGNLFAEVSKRFFIQSTPLLAPAPVAPHSHQDAAFTQPWPTF